MTTSRRSRSLLANSPAQLAPPLSLPWLTILFAIMLAAPLVEPCSAQRQTPPKTTEDADGAKRAKDAAKNAKKTRKARPFRWVNPLNQQLPGVQHKVFRSPSMKTDVGYCIYLPPQYKTEPQQRFPVVYYLHGGRPGSEIKSVNLAVHIDKHIRAKRVAPMIYVFVNGGPISHYNLPERENAMGEDVFIRELIPHVDGAYRTIGTREGRGLEGFSQGGRGTARIMFKHPHLFQSAAPGGGGYATEKRISEENGKENESLVFAPGYNTWDLARKFAANPAMPQPPLKILIHVGDKGFNYENNLQYMAFLKTLDIPFQQLVTPGAPHSARIIYEKSGLEIMKFHADNFSAKE